MFSMPACTCNMHQKWPFCLNYYVIIIVMWMCAINDAIRTGAKLNILLLTLYIIAEMRTFFCNSESKVLGMGRSVMETGRSDSGDTGLAWSFPGTFRVDLIMTNAVGQKMAIVCTTQLSWSISDVW